MKKKNLTGIGVAILNHRMQSRGFRPKIHRSVYPSLRKLIQECWKNDPSERPTFDDILKLLGGAVYDEVNNMEEPRFDIDYPDDEVENEESMKNRNNRFDLVDELAQENAELMAKNKALELKVKTQEELIAKFKNAGSGGNETVGSLEATKKGGEENNGTGTGRVEVVESKKRGGENNGVANILGMIAAGGSQKAHDRRKEKLKKVGSKLGLIK